MNYTSPKELVKEYNAKMQQISLKPLNTPEYKELKQRLDEISFSLDLIAESYDQSEIEENHDS